jgi:hypothetical protein
MFADEIGADGYGADASSAVDLFLYFMGQGEAPQASFKAGVAPTKSQLAAQRGANPTSRYQILYWQNLPSEIKVWDDFEQLKVALHLRFTERIDKEAMKLGLTQADAYSAQLRWGDETERPGIPADVGAAVGGVQHRHEVQRGQRAGVASRAVAALQERRDDLRVAHLNELLQKVANANQATTTFVKGPPQYCNDPAIAENLAYRWDGVHAYKPGANLTMQAITTQLFAIPVS